MEMEGAGEVKGRFHADKRLVERLLRGDRRAFDEFFEGNARGLLRWATRRLRGNTAEAEEIVQTALCSAVAGIETYRGEASLFTWLCTCCHYEILRRRRLEARRPSEIGLDDPVLQGSGALGGGRSPHRDFEELEMGERIHLTLDRLPEGYGEVLELKYLEGLSVEQIANRLGITPKAAESRLSRARRTFKSTYPSTGSGSPRWPSRQEGPGPDQGPESMERK